MCATHHGVQDDASESGYSGSRLPHQDLVYYGRCHGILPLIAQLLFVYGILNGHIQILLILSVPAFRKRFFTYGARGQTTAKKDTPTQPSSTVHKENATHSIERFLDHLATYSVPHSWFLHFYAFSVALSFFWAYQITTQSSFFVTLANWTHDGNSHMTSEQTVIAWWCLLIQGCRRLVECIQGPKSTSRMWIVHWFIGMTYYAAANIAIWIEGSSEPL